MTYLKISNRGCFNRKYLELIGLSTKRELIHDPSIIGFKGSGIKLAAVAALRLGLRAAVASTDGLGRYLLSYDVEEIDVDGRKFQQVIFNYDPCGEKDGQPYALRYPSQMTIDAFADWDRGIGDDGNVAFKVLREFVCNAADAGEYRFEFVERPEPAGPDETAVYLLYTDDLGRIFDRPERYFKFLYRSGGRPEEPVFAAPGIGSIYRRSDVLKTRLFVLGVLVDCTGYSWRSSLYDYSLERKDLISEERVIKSFHEYTAELGKLFGELTEPGMAVKVLAGVRDHKGMIEEIALNSVRKVSADSRKIWLRAAQALFGQKIAVSSGNQNIDLDANQIYGYAVVGSGHLALTHFLKIIGVPDARIIVPERVEENEYDLVAYGDLDAASRDEFDLAFGLFARHYPEQAKLPIVFFRPKSDRLQAWAGFAGSGDGCFKEIWIAAAGPDTLGPARNLLATLVHEARHCLTEAGDYERDFVNKADEEIVQLIFKEAGLFDRLAGAAWPPLTDAPAIRPNLADPAEIKKKRR